MPKATWIDISAETLLATSDPSGEIDPWQSNRRTNSEEHNSNFNLWNNE